MHRTIRFPDDLDAQLVALAAREDRSFSNAVIHLLKRQLSSEPETMQRTSMPSKTQADYAMDRQRKLNERGGR